MARPVQALDVPRTYRVAARDREPLIRWMREALAASGCRVIHASPPNEAPFRISFVLPTGERMGIVAYAFLANSRATKNRPLDEHRFQIKYGSKDDQLHELWQDPFGLYTTLLAGINPERGFFVGADPTLHNPTPFFISLEFKDEHVTAIESSGWTTWERGRRKGDDDPVEVLVGGRSDSFLRYVLFEREALGEDQGHRQLLAERTVYAGPGNEGRGDLVLAPSVQRLHALAREFDLTESEVLDLIAGTPHVKKAVRGSVAEEHLVRVLERTPGFREVCRVADQGEIDVSVRLDGGRTIGIQCKNVLRKTTRDGLVRVDFQRTRAAKADPCSRYYAPSDFDLVAACLHAVAERWTFKFALPGQLDLHPKCPGKLASNVRLDERWVSDARALLQGAG